MSIKDVTLDLMTAQDITTSDVSEYTLNLAAAGDAMEELYLVVQVGSADFDSSGDASTLTLELQGHEDSSFSTGTLTLIKTAALAQTALKAGAKCLVARVGRGVEQYLRINYTCSAAFTAGTLDAYLTTNPDLSWSKSGITGD